MESHDPLYNIRHSLAHLLAMAVLEHDPQALRTIGPVIDNGFYYDFELSKPLSPADLPKIKKSMKKLVQKAIAFAGEEITADEARELFKDNPYKLELIEEFVAEGKNLTAYYTGTFADLCAGGHVENTSEINPESFTLTKIAGAYWRGNEKNKMLTRIYGVAFETKEELETYQKNIEEAEKRDHRKLGKELGLFVFSPLVGPGLPLWTPKGTILRSELDAFVWQLRKKRGYNKVTIPHITKKDLYETSGHWAKFSEELMKIHTREEKVYAMKPMNCPHHTQIYASEKHSYRELPIRYAETTMVYRDEQSGELSGLSRVLSITQDDAHVFCRESQIKQEAFAIWDIIDEFYGTLGLPIKHVRLSFHDPKKIENYLGSPETWEKAESALRNLVEERGVTFVDGVGEAALYGPKIDFIAHDALGREWQVATIQLDMNLPERFDLTCTNEKSEEERIVMIHAAIMGSFERFLAIYIEHSAGVFPLWLSPVQVAVLPIGEGEQAYANEIAQTLTENNIRVEVYKENETLGAKIRRAKLEKVPYFLVIGKKELEDGTVTVETRGGEKIGALPYIDFMEKVLSEIKDKR
jgi:threonyl-tRNA synthetase